MREKRKWVQDAPVGVMFLPALMVLLGLAAGLGALLGTVAITAQPPLFLGALHGIQDRLRPRAPRERLVPASNSPHERSEP